MTQAVQSPEAKALADAAKRISAEMTLHALAGKAGSWCAFWLATGEPQHCGVAYDSRVDSVRAARHDLDRVIYLEVQADGMPEREAVAVLQFARALHNAGFRIPSPEFEFDPTMPLLRADRVKTVRHLASGGGRFPLRRG